MSTVQRAWPNEIGLVLLIGCCQPCHSRICKDVSTVSADRFKFAEHASFLSNGYQALYQGTTLVGP
jgi:hypothetical protein